MHGNSAGLDEGTLNQPAQTSAKGKITIEYSSTTVTSLKENYEAKSGYVFLILTLTIKNISADSFSVSPVPISIIIDNVKYSYYWGSSAMTDSLQSADLLKDGTTHGRLAYEIPSALSNEPYQLHYDTVIPDSYDITYIQE